MNAQPCVVIAGASGFIGRTLCERFTQDGWRVRTIGRGADNDATWDGDLRGVLEGADALVNLAGRSVSCRYTRKNADLIFASRTETTQALGVALAACDAPPPVWLNASTGTIYRDARDHGQSERDGELGSGFSVSVARAWERELFDAPTDVRKVALRMTIVLGAGGALNPVINLARMGFGGRQGDGDQRVSWVHVDDVYRAVRFTIEHGEISGPVNVAAPDVVTNTQFMTAVRQAFAGRRPGVPLPAWSLDAGAGIIRTESELVLKSRWVVSQKLIDEGFTFEFPTLDTALADIAAHTRRGLLPVQLG